MSNLTEAFFVDVSIVLNSSVNLAFYMHWWEVLQKFNKNAAEIDIAPALGKITKNLKYRSRGPGQGMF